MFLLTKAALAGLITTGITLIGLFGQPGNRFRMLPSTELSTATGSSADCNCVLISKCQSFFNGQSIRGRFCGFEGFQRKVCCAPDNDQTELTESQREAAEVEKFYRNPNLYKNEGLNFDSSQNGRAEDLEENGSKKSISPMEILSSVPFGTDEIKTATMDSVEVQEVTSVTSEPISSKMEVTTNKFLEKSEEILTPEDVSASSEEIMIQTTSEMTPQSISVTSEATPVTTESATDSVLKIVENLMKSMSTSPTEESVTITTTEEPKESRTLLESIADLFPDYYETKEDGQSGKSSFSDKADGDKINYTDTDSVLAQFFPDYYEELIKNLTATSLSPEAVSVETTTTDLPVTQNSNISDAPLSDNVVTRPSSTVSNVSTNNSVTETIDSEEESNVKDFGTNDDATTTIVPNVEDTSVTPDSKAIETSSTASNSQDALVTTSNPVDASETLPALGFESTESGILTSISQNASTSTSAATSTTTSSPLEFSTSVIPTSEFSENNPNDATTLSSNYEESSTSSTTTTTTLSNTFHSESFLEEELSVNLEPNPTTIKTIEKEMTDTPISEIFTTENLISLNLDNSSGVHVNVEKDNKDSFTNNAETTISSIMTTEPQNISLDSVPEIQSTTTTKSVETIQNAPSENESTTESELMTSSEITPMMISEAIEKENWESIPTTTENISVTSPITSEDIPRTTEAIPITSKSTSPVTEESISGTSEEDISVATLMTSEATPVTISTESPLTSEPTTIKLDINPATTTQKSIEESLDFTISNNEQVSSSTAASSLIKETTTEETENIPTTTTSSDMSENISSTSEASKPSQVVDRDESAKSFKSFNDLINELEQSGNVDDDTVNSSTEVPKVPTPVPKLSLPEETTESEDVIQTTTNKNLVPLESDKNHLSEKLSSESPDIQTTERNSLPAETTMENTLVQKLPKLAEVESTTISSMIDDAITTIKSGVSAILNSMSLETNNLEITTISNQENLDENSSVISTNVEATTLGNLIEKSSTVQTESSTTAKKEPIEMTTSHVDTFDITVLPDKPEKQEIFNLEKEILNELEKSSTNSPITTTPESRTESSTTIQSESKLSDDDSTTSIPPVDSEISTSSNSLKNLILDEITTISPIISTTSSSHSLEEVKKLSTTSPITSISIPSKIIKSSSEIETTTNIIDEFTTITLETQTNHKSNLEPKSLDMTKAGDKLSGRSFEISTDSEQTTLKNIINDNDELINISTTDPSISSSSTTSRSENGSKSLDVSTSLMPEILEPEIELLVENTTPQIKINQETTTISSPKASIVEENTTILNIENELNPSTTISTKSKSETLQSTSSDDEKLSESLTTMSTIISTTTMPESLKPEIVESTTPINLETTSTSKISTKFDQEEITTYETTNQNAENSSTISTISISKDLNEKTTTAYPQTNQIKTVTLNPISSETTTNSNSYIQTTTISNINELLTISTEIPDLDYHLLDSIEPEISGDTFNDKKLDTMISSDELSKAIQKSLEEDTTTIRSNTNVDEFETTSVSNNVDVTGRRIPEGNKLIEDYIAAENDTLNELIPQTNQEFVLNITEIFPTKRTEIIGSTKVNYGEDFGENEIKGDEVSKSGDKESENSSTDSSISPQPDEPTTVSPEGLNSTSSEIAMSSTSTEDSDQIISTTSIAPENIRESTTTVNEFSIDTKTEDEPSSDLSKPTENNLQDTTTTKNTLKIISAMNTDIFEQIITTMPLEELDNTQMTDKPTISTEKIISTTTELSKTTENYSQEATTTNSPLDIIIGNKPTDYKKLKEESTFEEFNISEVTDKPVISSEKDDLSKTTEKFPLIDDISISTTINPLLRIDESDNTETTDKPEISSEINTSTTTLSSESPTKSITKDNLEDAIQNYLSDKETSTDSISSSMKPEEIEATTKISTNDDDSTTTSKSLIEKFDEIEDVTISNKIVTEKPNEGESTTISMNLSREDIEATPESMSSKSDKEATTMSTSLFETSDLAHNSSSFTTESTILLSTTISPKSQQLESETTQKSDNSDDEKIKTSDQSESTTQFPIRRVDNLDINFINETLDEITTIPSNINVENFINLNATISSLKIIKDSESTTLNPEFDEIFNLQISDSNKNFENSTKAFNLILESGDFTTNSPTLSTSTSTEVSTKSPTKELEQTMPTSTVKHSQKFENITVPESHIPITTTEANEIVFTEANTDEPYRNSSSVVDTTDSIISFDPSDTLREKAENINSTTSIDRTTIATALTEDEVTTMIPISLDPTIIPGSISSSSDSVNLFSEITTTLTPESMNSSLDSMNSSSDSTNSSSDSTNSSPDSTTLTPESMSLNSDSTNSSLDSTNSPDSTTFTPESTSLNSDSTNSSPDSTTLTPESINFNSDSTTLTPVTSTLEPEEVITSVSRVISKPKVIENNESTTQISIDQKTSTETTHSIRKEPEKDKTVVELVRELSKVKNKITHSIHKEQNLISSSTTVPDYQLINETTTSKPDSDFDVTKPYIQIDQNNTSSISSLINENYTSEFEVTDLPETKTDINLTFDLTTENYETTPSTLKSVIDDITEAYDDTTSRNNYTDESEVTEIPIAVNLNGTFDLESKNGTRSDKSLSGDSNSLTFDNNSDIREMEHFKITNDTHAESIKSLEELSQTTNQPTLEEETTTESHNQELSDTENSKSGYKEVAEASSKLKTESEALKIVEEFVTLIPDVIDETTASSISSPTTSTIKSTSSTENFSELLETKLIPETISENTSEIPSSNITESITFTTSETRSTQPDNQSLSNLFNEIFGSFRNPSDPNNTLHPVHHYPARINDRKLVLEITQPPAEQILTPDPSKVDSSTSDPFDPELIPKSDELLVSIKIGPGPGPTPGARALYPGEAMEVEAQLQNQISNVVNQLLLTTHENYRLLPSFIECASATRRGRRKTRVLNFDTENYPWMARIGYQEPGGVTFSCAGTIISRRYILTSAYCANKKPGAIKEVLLESAKHLSKPTELKYKYEVDKIIPHPEFDQLSRLNDLALLRVTSDIQFNSSSEIKPICLPFEDGYGVWDSIPKVGDLAYLGGWGFEQKKNKTKKLPDLQESSVRIWRNENCTKAFEGDKNKVVTSNQICAYASPENNACRGDGGAPLMAVMTRHRIFFQIGVVSYGPQCGLEVPRVYTRVSEYLRWILDTMEP